MNQYNLTAISPIDGRYHNDTSSLQEIFSESALMMYRVRVEALWLKKLSTVFDFNYPSQELHDILFDFTTYDAEEIKEIESTTNHDVKAVEIFVRQFVPKEIEEYVHFGCTSEDINNLAYGLMIDDGRKILNEAILNIQAEVAELADKFIKVPMLARTHGQPATPTTVGKEFSVFYHRLSKQRTKLKFISICGKFNGASGNFNALYAAEPNILWENIAHSFIQEFGFIVSHSTTQIEPQDYIVEICNSIAHLNDILIDLCRDMWGYISLDYFKQKIIKNEVGSSTMPHKVNPINFENAEANFGVANALLNHLAAELPKSRWQRDLTNSSRLRNIGVAFAHSLLGYKSLLKGLEKLEINKPTIEKDLDNNWAVLAEAVQTVMRRHQIPDAYNRLKDFTRGKPVDKEILHQFINSLEIPNEVKSRLLNLTPSTYLGSL